MRALSLVQGQEWVVNQLRAVDFLKEFSHAELYALVTEGDVITLKAEQMLLEQGSDGLEIFLLISGTVGAYRISANQKRVLLKQILAPAIVGEMSLLLDEVRTADVVAFEDATLLKIPKQVLAADRCGGQKLMFIIAQSLARRVKETSDKLEEMITLDVASRLLRELQSRAQVFDESTLIIREGLHHKLLAEMVGSSREVISRSLKLLEESGEISRVEGTLFIKRR